MVKLLFLGSGDFPSPILQKLVDGKRFDIVGLITSKPDSFFSGKSVESTAKENKVRVFKPLNFKDEYTAILEETKPDLVLVCNFGEFLKQDFLDYPKYSCLNIHASLLPLLRGACPIEIAILQGYEKTGITVQSMALAMDKGDILFQESVPITKDETGGSLRNKLQKLAIESINKVLDDWVNHKITPIVQDENKATYCYMKDISKEAARIDWSKSAEYIDRMIRAFNPRPTAWSMLSTDGSLARRIKFFKSFTSDRSIKLNIGETLVEKDKLYIQTGKGTLIPLEIQQEGKKRIAISDFLRGFRNKIIFK